MAYHVPCCMSNTRPKIPLVVQLQGFHHTLRQICLAKFIFSYFYPESSKGLLLRPPSKNHLCTKKTLAPKGGTENQSELPPCQPGPNSTP